MPPNKSVRSDHIVCLLDGKKFKSLKRHLRTNHNMTPQEYRAAFGLRPDYPMVAPAYAKARSELALATGLGQKSKRASAEPPESSEGSPKSEPEPSPSKKPKLAAKRASSGARKSAKVSAKGKGKAKKKKAS